MTYVCQFPKYKSLDTENEFLNPIWMWGQNETRY